MSEVTLAPVRVALVGCGHRGKQMLNLLVGLGGFKISALVDDVPAARKSPEGTPGFGYEEFWGSKEYKEGTDLVMVASVNNLHAKHIVRPLEDGKYVFCEKPLFTEWDEKVVAIILKNKERFCTGFVLRHSLFYQTIKKEIPKIGKIWSGSVSDLLHYGHGALIFGGGWRHDPDKSGGHVVEKLVHVIDLLVWYLDDGLKNATGFKGQDVWVRENEGISKKWIENSDNEKLLEAYSFHGSNNPFDHAPGEIVESSGNLALRFESGATIGIHFDTACTESRREFYLVGETGTIRALWTHAKSYVEVSTRGVGTKATKGRPNRSEVFQFEPVGCHGGGDEFIVKALREVVVNGAPPNPGAEEALRTMNATLTVQRGIGF